MATVSAEAPAELRSNPTRSAAQASRAAFVALLERDMAVLRKNIGEFVGRTVIQPFLLVFVFLYVFPTIGQGIGGARGIAGESAFATILVAGVVGLSIMFQGIQSVALPMSAEFGYTKEIQDRVLAPMPVSLVAIGKVTTGAIQGLIAALIVFPIAAVVHARDVFAHLAIHWPVVVTLIPLTCIMCASLGLLIGSRVEPRNIGAMFGFLVLPMTFLGGTYYPWTTLANVKVGGWSWLQTLVLVNPLLYVTEGFRAALTRAPHMHLYIVYAGLIGFCVLFLWLGIKGFRKRVLA
jgi:ABC-2 type transport system permease protein